MDRLVLRDGAWERMAPLVIGRPDQKSSTGRGNRMFVEAVLWIVRRHRRGAIFPELTGVLFSLPPSFSSSAPRRRWAPARAVQRS